MLLWRHNRARRRRPLLRLLTLSYPYLPSSPGQLCAELVGEDRPDDVRRMAGLLIKKSLAPPDHRMVEAKRRAWAELPPALKSQMRAAFLATLASPKKMVRRVCAQIIAVVGTVDLPTGQWPELLPDLQGKVCGTPGSVQEGVVVASLEALGFMCEQLQDEEDAEISEKMSNAILTAVVHGMTDTQANEVRYAATDAMCNMLRFVEPNFERKPERDMIFSSLCSGTQCMDPKGRPDGVELCLRVRTKAFEACAEIVKLYYGQLKDYMDTLFKLTFTAITADLTTTGAQDVGIMALEFWTMIGETEADMIDDGELDAAHSYVNLALPQLMPLLCQTLTKQEGEEQDRDSWNIAVAGAICLLHASKCARNAICAHVLPFVASNMTSANW